MNDVLIKPLNACSSHKEEAKPDKITKRQDRRQFQSIGINVDDQVNDVLIKPLNMYEKEATKDAMILSSRYLGCSN